MYVCTYICITRWSYTCDTDFWAKVTSFREGPSGKRSSTAHSLYNTVLYI